MNMKTFSSIVTTLFILLCTLATSQVPAAMKYQAMARDASGAAIANEPVSFRIQVLAGTMSGTAVFTETHQVMTDAFGIVHLNIGEGTAVSGTLEGVSWGTDLYFLRVEMDAQGGTNYQPMGTSQLLTVPYAFFSHNGVQTSADIVCGEDTEGMIRYNYEEKILELCNGTEWVAVGQGSSGSWTCGEVLIDSRDGQSYATVRIGDQCWMAENLNDGTFKESVITGESHADVSNNGIVEKYAYDNDEAQLELTGGLYDWNEMMNYTTTESGQGICPDGWHVPSYDEFVVLVEAVGDWLQAGKTLKVGGGTGFEFKMGGNRREKGIFTGGEGTGSMWTSTLSAANPDTRAWNIYFIENGDNAAKATDLMVVGKSCRCIRD